MLLSLFLATAAGRVRCRCVAGYRSAHPICRELSSALYTRGFIDQHRARQDRRRAMLSLAERGARLLSELDGLGHVELRFAKSASRREAASEQRSRGMAGARQK